MRKKISSLAVYERAKKEGKYIVDTKSTIRETAKVYKLSKTTIHRDVTEVLESFHDPLAKEVKKVLDKNYLEKNIRGGNATKQKLLQKKHLL